MTTVKATDASNRFGQLLDTARLEPVTIEKQGRAVAVMLSVEEYRRMQEELAGLKSRLENDAGWEGFVASLYGCLSEDPIERAPQPALEEREALPVS